MSSNRYNISNHVRQGGCLSPTHFSIYENFIDILHSLNFGYRYDNHYMGVTVSQLV